MKNVDTGTDIYGKWQENWLKWEPGRGWGFVRLASVPHLNFRDFPLDRRPGFPLNEISSIRHRKRATPLQRRCSSSCVSFVTIFFQREDETFFFNARPSPPKRTFRSSHFPFISSGMWHLNVGRHAIGRWPSRDSLKRTQVPPVGTWRDESISCFGGEDQTLSWYRQITGRTGRLMFAADAARRRWRRGAVHFFFFFSVAIIFFFRKEKEWDKHFW